MAASNQDIKFYEHPEFVHWYPKWRAFRDLYENEHHVLTAPAYLVPHELETSTAETADGKELVGNKIRSIRVARTRNLNLFEPIVSNYISMALSKPLSMDAAAKKLLEDDGALENVDGRGTSFENWVKGPVATTYFRDGKVYVLADAPEAPEGGFKTRKEQIDARQRPYLSVVDVLELKDWQATETEQTKLRWFRTEYRAVEPRESPQDAPTEASYTKVYTLSGDGVVQVQVYKKEDGEKKPWVLQSTQPLSLAELPLAVLPDNEPWVKDVAEQQRSLLNHLSAWLNLLNAQAFERTFVIGDLGEKHAIAVSEYAMPVLPAGSNVITLPPVDTSAHERAIEWTIDAMYRVAFNRTRGLAADSKEAPSEDTLREMNKELLDLLLVAISEIEAVVNQALKHYAAFKGVQDFQGKVELNKTLTVADVDRMVTSYLAYKDEIVQNLPWRKAHLKKVVALEDFSDDEKKDILAEIDNLKAVEPLTGVASLAGVADTLAQDGGRPGGAPQDTGDETGRAGGGRGGGAGAAAAGVSGPAAPANPRKPRRRA